MLEVLLMMTMVRESRTTDGTLSVNRDSRAIAKVKQKIRIVHLFTSEIIKTDIANFREVVQRLTGKQADNNSTDHSDEKTVEILRPAAVKVKRDMPFSFEGWDVKDEEINELKKGGRSTEDIESSGSEDMDGFIQSLIQIPQVSLKHGN